MTEFSDAFETFVDSFMRGRVHTAQPGTIDKIVSANPPIVNVQPSFMRLREGDEAAEKRPVIPNVPLIFPVFGDYGITASLTVGAPVLLIAAERSIKSWVEQGGTVDPGIDRAFDLADCVAIPGLPNKAIEWSVPDEGVQVGTIDGETVIIIKDGEITTKTPDLSVVLDDELTVGGGADYVALAQKVEDKVQAIVDAITNAAPGSMDGGAAYKAAMIALLNASLPAIGPVAAQKTKTD
jgi:phage tail protein X